MSKSFKSDFLEMRVLYEETMSEIGEELREIAAYPSSECDDCDAPEYIEAAVAESHCKIISSVVERAMNIVGKSIYSAADKEYKINTDMYKKGDCLHFGSGLKSCYALYIGFGKIVFYSKGYDIFPEVKIASLGSIVKSSNNIIVLENYHAGYSPEEAVKRGTSMLGSSKFKSSESFVKWCFKG